MLNSKKNTPNTKKNVSAVSVADIVVRRSQQAKKRVPLLTENVIRAGAYHSTIIAVEDACNDEGKPMADVTYHFVDANGKATDARVRYPVAGYHIERLFDALIEAGLSEGAPLTDAVGIEEEVTIVYPHDGALGKIKSRRPAAQVAKTVPTKSIPKKASQRIFEEDEDDEEEPVDDDSEFDDFLEESD